MTFRRIDQVHRLCQNPLMLSIFVLLVAALLFLILMSLRYGKGMTPLRRAEGTPLPGFPGPIGLINRLDGIERKQRDIIPGRAPNVKADGSMTLPLRWEDDVTAGRLACVAHTWALAQLSDQDPEGGKKREQAVTRTHIVTFFTALIVIALVFIKHLDTKTAMALVAGVWAMLSFIAIPTQFREWKALEVARTGLKNAGLWPRLESDAHAIDTCLKAMTWCRVAGFRRILPR
ncbi:MAG: hypothetical protein RR138_03655 [Akkermansia sp.]